MKLKKLKHAIEKSEQKTHYSDELCDRCKKRYLLPLIIVSATNSNSYRYYVICQNCFDKHGIV